MTRGSIANIERGEQTPGLYRLLLICGALDCDLADVLPSDVLTPEAVADATNTNYSSALDNVRRAAAKQRKAAVIRR
ncbi:hypothetical protein EDD33_1796 [Nocardioides aurantiacus]|uniref:HTH cro/C1-type domain-containing protein n=2 Tax=Nocardioides aurantiacus TaxID=86796 RepID=A0A3N2CTS7_9ACTN|nr:hypothetical protein EDD33_1796 [Nocardioides aurantiacus]